MTGHARGTCTRPRAGQMNGPRTLRRPPGCADGYGRDPAKAATFRRHRPTELAGTYRRPLPGGCAPGRQSALHLLTAPATSPTAGQQSSPSSCSTPEHPSRSPSATGAGRVAYLAGAGALLAMTVERILRGAAKECPGVI